MTDDNKNKKESDNKIEKLVKQLLADHLGTDPDEIANEDSLTDNLSMGPTDLSDFIGLLSSEGINTRSLDLSEIDTVEDLIESLSSEEVI